MTKADRSLVDCLCECVDNILRGNVPLTKPQKEKLARNKAGLRALTKKSVSLKKKKAILQIKNQLHELIWLKYYSRSLAFCKYTNSLVCFFKRWETMLLLPHLS
jgi:hypothetical protein